MARTVQKRPVEFDVEYGGTATEQGSSPNIKRPKKSYEFSDDDEDEAEAVIVSEDEGEDSGDYDSDEDSEDEAFRQINSQAPLTPKKRSAEYGIIMSVELKNFMCHDHLKLQFGSNINFVIGHNGSGKSAILTAITVCLGGKASVTQRANSIKGLVKYGMARASVTCELLNSPNGFKYEVYGDKISVERTFDTKGTSQYLIRNHAGKVVSRSRDELVEMMDTFLLVVDNPMTLLSQDTARSFLTSASPEEKYQLFMKGIRLDEVKLDYDNTLVILDNTERSLRGKRKDLMELAKQVHEFRELYERSQSARALTEKIFRLHSQYAWTLVQEQETTLEELDEEIKINKAEYAMAAAEVNAKRQEKEEAARQHQEILREKAVLQVKKDEATQNIVEKRNDMKLIKDELQRVIGDERNNANENDLIQRRLNLAQEKIDKEIELQSEQDGGTLARLNAEHNELEDQLQQLEMNRKTTSDDIARLEVSLKEAGDRKAKAAAQVVTHEGAVTVQEKQIESVKSKMVGTLSAFPPATVQVQRDIANEHRFRVKPVGPLGMHVKLKDPSWSGILESFFGRSLDAYAVSCNEDEGLLKSILSKHGINTTIFNRKNTPIDYSNSLPSREFTTILDVLEIDNDYVKTILIDQHRIEKMILIPSRAQGDSVMAQRPRNVLSCLTHNAKGFGGFRLNSLDGSSSTSPIPGRKGNPRMKTDEASLLRSYEQQRDRVLAELERSRMASAQADRAYDDVNRQLQSAKTKLSNLLRDRKTCADRLEEIKRDLSDSHGSGKLESLQEQLETIKNELEQSVRNYENIIIEKHTQEESLKAATRAIEEAKLESEKVTEELEVLKRRENEAVERELSAKAALEYRENQMAGRLAAKTRLDSAYSNAEEILQLYRTEAANLEPTPPELCGKTCNEIMNLIGKTEEEQKRARSELPMRPEEIERQYNTLNKQYHGIKKELEDLCDLRIGVGQSYAERVDNYLKFRNQICQRAKDIFSMSLSNRGFQGRLFINHAHGTLHIQVQPVDTGSKGERNVKTLSGGEKSFTQICLLLSLWDAMNCPVRGLDEFDVYMDAINRATSLKLMIDAASKADDVQTIFITPQDMGTVKLNDSVKIIRMADPERAAAA